MVSPNVILADVLMEFGDEDQKFLTPGYYNARIRDAMNELSFDSFYLEVYGDYPFPTDTLAFKVPSGMFNLKEVYIYNGDCCEISGMQNVWYKSRYNTKGVDKGYTAKNKAGNSGDPFIKEFSDDSKVYYCNVVNGWIQFSPSCNSYEKVRIVYSGCHGDLMDVPSIPLLFKEAIRDWVIERCYRVLKNRDPRKYRSLWSDAWSISKTPIVGTWDSAITRASSMDSKTREDLLEYMSKMNY